MGQKLEITQENVVAAYNNASEEQKQLLVDLFGKDVFKQTDVRERIKSFHDAYCELGNEHPFVVAYEKYVNSLGGEEKDIIAYLQLRIIVAALNEGWEPEFVEDEYRYYPWFYLYTNKEIENMNDEQKARVCRVVGRANNVAYASGGLVYSYASNVSTNSYTGNGSRLAFKTEELAEYAGKQFIEIYRDFMIAQQ